MKRFIFIQLCEFFDFSFFFCLLRRSRSKQKKDCRFTLATGRELQSSSRFAPCEEIGVGLCAISGGAKDINVRFSTLESVLKTGNKKAIVSVRTEEFGAHALIVDKIENGRVFLRDPLPMFNGSAYSVTIADFTRVSSPWFVSPRTIRSNLRFS
jgi:hypothetical protein